jgi:hypothetical protein
METSEMWKREIKALVFDQYGTIVDMQTGLAEIASPFLKNKDWDGEAHRFVTWWRRTHFENSMIDALCDRGHTPYRQIGHHPDRGTRPLRPRHAEELRQRRHQGLPAGDVGRPGHVRNPVVPGSHGAWDT